MIKTGYFDLHFRDNMPYKVGDEVTSPVSDGFGNVVSFQGVGRVIARGASCWGPGAPVLFTAEVVHLWYPEEDAVA